MKNLLQFFEATRSRKNDVNIDNSFRAGDEIVVSVAYTENGKERIQTFRGNVIQRRHPSSSGETFTIMKRTEGVRVEMTFYINSPLIRSIKVLNRAKVGRGRLFFLRKPNCKYKIKYKILKKNNENDVLDGQVVVEEEQKNDVLPDNDKKEGQAVDEQNGDAHRNDDKREGNLEDSDGDYIDEIDVLRDKK